MRLILMAFLSSFLLVGTGISADNASTELDVSYEKAKIVLMSTRAANYGLDLIFIAEAKDLDKAEDLSKDLVADYLALGELGSEDGSCKDLKAGLKKSSKSLKKIFNLKSSKKPKSTSSWGRFFYDSLEHIVKFDKKIKKSLKDIDCDDGDDDDLDDLDDDDDLENVGDEK